MHSSRRRRRQLLAGVAAVGSALALAAVVPSASAASAPKVVPNSTPRWLHSASALGRTAGSTEVDFGVLLKMSHADQAAAQIQQLSTPGSAEYGKWLTNAQFDSKYGASAASVAAVRSWLAKLGFGIRGTLRSGLYVEARGTAASIDKAFGTTLMNYRYRGTTVMANSTALTLPSSTPAAVSSALSGILGLDEGSSLKTPAAAAPPPPPGARYGVQPCSKYYAQKIATDKPKAYGAHQPYAVCGYVPSQYQSAYGESSLINAGVNGHGITVAITDAYAAPTILNDAQQYSRVHHQPTFKSGQFTQITPGADGYNHINECGGNGWYGEETLDVEAVHAMAPGAKVVYVGAPNCIGGLDEAWASTIDNHVADIVTNSWSDGVDTVDTLGQAYIDYYVDFSTEAALTGITVNFSSGDDGDYTQGGTQLANKTVGFPSDLPYVTGVGGTSVEVGNKGQWLAEYGWSSAYSQFTDGAWTPKPPGVYSSGSGGGTSQLFAQPFYQHGVVPGSISKYYGKTPMRAVPDFSMPGDPNTGFLVGETQKFPDGTYWDQYRIGGTSLSSPLLAGVLAVAEQYAGHKLGFVNPLYYDLLGTSGAHDTAKPSQPVAQVRTNYANNVDASQGYTYELQTIDVQSSTLKDRRGYDDMTGVGTPGGRAFFTLMKQLSK